MEPEVRPLGRRVAIVTLTVVAGFVGAAWVGASETAPNLRLTQTRGDSSEIVALPDAAAVDSTPATVTAPPQPRPAPVRTPAPAPARPPARVTKAPARESRPVVRPVAEPLALPPPPVLPDVSTTQTNDAAPGHLWVSVVPWGDVSVDGQPAGTSPVVNFPVAPGQHRLRISRSGFEPYERTITVNGGESLRLTDIVLKRRS